METKPTFGNNLVNEEKIQQVIQMRNSRPETGAIWKKLSKKSNTEYLSVEVVLTKEKLEELLSKSSNGLVKLNLVGFINKFQNGSDRRPAFRLYEDIGLGIAKQQ